MPDYELAQHVPTFRKRLIQWYDRNARDLPWRSEPSLYKTVVSEFMLQQTQVKTVLPYFHAWLEAYPDFESLAAAPEEKVLKSWEGLGYYSRARNLHKSAAAIAAFPPDELPTDAKSWTQFPGIGPYAAAAICSISFNDPTAVVDGNVVRILSRLRADEKEYKNSGEAAKRYQNLAQELLNVDRAGDHNQAMMELGATVCHKRSPNCLLCPVNELCEAKRMGIAETLPRLVKTKIETLFVERAWIRDGASVLLYKIPSTAKRMKGLHELPELKALSLPQPSSNPLLERKRSITRYRITERIYAIAPKSLPDPLPGDYFWANVNDVPELAFSGPHRRWISELLASG